MMAGSQFDSSFFVTVSQDDKRTHRNLRPHSPPCWPLHWYIPRPRVYPKRGEHGGHSGVQSPNGLCDEETTKHTEEPGQGKWWGWLRWTCQNSTKDTNTDWEQAHRKEKQKEGEEIETHVEHFQLHQASDEEWRRRRGGAAAAETNGACWWSLIQMFPCYRWGE